MALSEKDYRSHLYENRTHPETENKPEKKNAPSFSIWILSAVPFLLIEYFFEVEFKRLPSGLIFPAGFVLFWGFYHSILFSNKITIPKKKIKRTPVIPFPKAKPAPPNDTKKTEDFLPEKILQNLSVLGLKPTRDWNLIHKRYRELAKQYHPDLNPEVTTRGTRFMIYDAAYRNLLKFKKEYFR